MAKLHSIKFNVENPQTLRTVEGPVKVLHKGGLELIQFATGWGPCGRWVAHLEYVIDLATLRIKQTSFSKDMTEADGSYNKLVVELIGARAHATKVGRSPGLCDQVKAAEEALEEAQRFGKEDCKIETFIYKLEDVRGRIHALLKEAS